jgi:hypothetical protein
MLISRIIIIPVLTVLLHASNGATLKRQTFELEESYDFIIAGGGTAGLTVADRLSEAFPKSTFFVPLNFAALPFSLILTRFPFVACDTIPATEKESSSRRARERRIHSEKLFAKDVHV